MKCHSVRVLHLGTNVQRTAGQLPRVMPLIVIALLAIVPFIHPLLTGQILNPGDVRIEYFPQFLETRQQLLAGTIPMWDPGGFIGRPLLPYMNAVPTFYPVTQLLLRLPDPVVGFTLDWPIHFFIAGLSMYGYLRTIELRRRHALAGALIFMLAGVTFHRIIHPSHLRPIAFIPAILLFVELGLRRHFLFFVAAGVVTGLQVLSGHPQPIVYSSLAVAAYCLWRAGEDSLRNGQLRPLWRGLAGYLLVIGLGLGIGAVQILPMWEMLRYSDRAGQVEPGFFSSHAIDLRELPQALMPLVYGEPEAGTFWGSRWRHASLYIGILPLLLAPFAFVGRHRRLAIFFGLSALLAMLLALGPATPLIRILYDVPIVNRFRSPSRFLHLYVLAMAVLGAMGLETLSEMRSTNLTRIVKNGIWIATGIGLALVGVLLIAQSSLSRWLHSAFSDLYAGRGPLVAFMTPDHPERQAYHLGKLEYAPETILFSGALLVVLLLISAVIFSLRGRIPSVRLSELAVGIIAIDLTFFGLRAGPLSTLPRSYFEDAPASVQNLPKDGQSFRILSWDGKVFRNGASEFSNEIFKVGVERIIWSNGEGVPQAYFFEEREILQPNIASLFGLQSFNTYGGLKIVQWDEIRQLLDGTGSVNEIGARHLLDLLNIRYILSSVPLIDSELRLIQAGDVSVYENISVLPRAFLVSNWRSAPDDATALEAISDPEFRPAEEAIVVGTMPVVSKSETSNLGLVTEMSMLPGQETYKVNVPATALLVNSNWNYPGWQAWIDGEPVPLLKVDYLLQGILLEPGESTVELVYRPQSFLVGAALSILATLMALAVVILGLRRPVPVHQGRIRPPKNKGRGRARAETDIDIHVQ